MYLQSIERFLGLQILAEADVLSVVRDFLLENLHRCQPGLAYLLVLVYTMGGCYVG